MGNKAGGVAIESDQNVVEGNFIGTDKTGTLAIPNGTNIATDAGVLILSGSYNVVGGSGAANRNAISGNVGDGVRIDGTTGGNAVASNWIGESSAMLPLPNTGNGVGMYDGAANNQIGAPGAGGNVIASSSNGVLVSGNETFGNSIRGNTIQLTGSQGLPIDLRPNASVGPGPNASIVPPVVLRIDNSTGQPAVSGTFHGTPSSSYSVDLYSDNGSGTFDYAASANVVTGATGIGGFTVPLGANANGQAIVAAVTDPDGNTSAFGSGALVPTAVAFKPSGTVAVAETTGTLTLTLTRSGDHSSAQSFAVSLEDITAAAGVDYTAPASTVVFAAGSATAQLAIPIVQTHTRTGHGPLR